MKLLIICRRKCAKDSLVNLVASLGSRLLFVQRKSFYKFRITTRIPELSHFVLLSAKSVASQWEVPNREVGIEKNRRCHTLKKSRNIRKSHVHLKIAHDVLISRATF